MNKNNLIKFFALGILLSFLSVSAFAQKNEANSGLIKRTKYQTETIEFGAGGTLVVLGSPEGSIEIEGWPKNEIEIAAEIEVQGYTEQDLAMMAEVTGFIIDQGLTKVSIISVGTHDQKYLKKVSKKFPKELRRMPFQISYKIKVPHYIGLEINGGKGDFKLSMVEGMMRINYLESDARMNLIGGAVQATIGSGNVDVTIGTRSWRGQFADVQVAKGNLNLWLPKNMNANLTAKVLQTGRIDNSYKLLKPMRLTKFTEKGMYAKVGNGGAELSFTVGEGMLKIADFETIAKN